MHAAAPMWRNGRRNGLKILSFTMEAPQSLPLHCQKSGAMAKIQNDARAAFSSQRQRSKPSYNVEHCGCNGVMTALT
jgi:hypothetical protein